VKPAKAATRGAVDLRRPLRTPAFRQLLIADVVSDVGDRKEGCDG
jgi:hypothetical protein